jgi:type 1 fimbria pilin
VKKLIALLALATGSLLFAAGNASAAGQVCYDLNVNVSGQAPIVQAGCQDLP